MTRFPQFAHAALNSSRKRGGGANRSWMLILAAAVTLACVTPPSYAQDQRNRPELRTVHGTVIDQNENPVSTSIVYLKNMKTQGVKTYITSEDGIYRFSGLDPNVDYQVHAEHNDLTSSSHTISSYDSRRDIDMPLKLSHKKER
ncbi:MAG TPA: carboxypeptidase-like regulatory domain-containing protein [Candidatus Acidoferrales bacterium]|nr:carboxypeptidase-like regulatory domain-containing protein [Candidatus Acidoferrales bacterium]